MNRICVSVWGLLLAFAPATVSASEGGEPDCSFNHSTPASGVVIGYIANKRTTGTTEVGTYRTLGLILDGSIEESAGSYIEEGMVFWSVLDAEQPAMELQTTSSFLDELGKDHCVYHGVPDRGIPRWTLLSSEPVRGMFARPTESDRKAFSEFFDGCVAGGEYEEADARSCSRRGLLALSDLDEDGDTEYWATEPYRWDTGITVWERSNSDFDRAYSACVGCSD